MVDEEVKNKVAEILHTIESLVDSHYNSDATGDDDPPLIMQSSNLPFNGLDIRHEGGGNRTSDDGNNDENDNNDSENEEGEIFEPPVKKRKIGFDDSINGTMPDYSLDTFDDKNSFDDSSCPFSKETNSAKMTESENDKISDGQMRYLVYYYFFIYILGSVL